MDAPSAQGPYRRPIKTAHTPANNKNNKYSVRGFGFFFFPPKEQDLVEHSVQIQWTGTGQLKYDLVQPALSFDIYHSPIIWALWEFIDQQERKKEDQAEVRNLDRKK